MAVGLFKGRRGRTAAAPARPVEPLRDDAFGRGPQTTADLVLLNGDDSPFVVTTGALRHGGGLVPVRLVASEVAAHLIDDRSESSAVSSYNRIVRFDRQPGEDLVVLGLAAYMGRRPVAEVIALGMGFPASELSFYIVEVPRSPEADGVIERIQVGFESRGVPPTAHTVGRFLY